jgi:RHS repeat-associated protein
MPSPPESLLCQYRYDALDRLITQALPSEPEQQRFYCKNRLATEIRGAIRNSIFQHRDQLLAQLQSEAGALDTTLLATDQQRSVLHTLKKNHQPHPIAYSPYGHRRPEKGLTSLLGFTGEWPDPVTGHYLLGNGHRAFNPALMQFIGPDMLSPFGKGGLNTYAYCLRDPINNLDPSGNVPLPFRVQFMATKWLTKTRAVMPPSRRTIASATKPEKAHLAPDFENLGQTNGKWSLTDNSSPASSVKPTARVAPRPISAQNSTTNLANTIQRAADVQEAPTSESEFMIRAIARGVVGALSRDPLRNFPPDIQAAIRAAAAPIVPISGHIRPPIQPHLP